MARPGGPSRPAGHPAGDAPAPGRRESESFSGGSHPLVVGEHSAEILAGSRRSGGVMASRVRSWAGSSQLAASRRSRSTTSCSNASRSTRAAVTVDPSDARQDLGDGELVRHDDDVVVVVISPGSERSALVLSDGEPHDGGGVQLPDAHHSSDRTAASASDAARRVFTGPASGPVTVTGFSRPAPRRRARTPPEDTAGRGRPRLPLAW